MWNALKLAIACSLVVAGGIAVYNFATTGSTGGAEQATEDQLQSAWTYVNSTPRDPWAPGSITTDGGVVSCGEFTYERTAPPTVTYNSGGPESAAFMTVDCSVDEAAYSVTIECTGRSNAPNDRTDHTASMASEIAGLAVGDYANAGNGLSAETIWPDSDAAARCPALCPSMLECDGGRFEAGDVVPVP